MILRVVDLNQPLDSGFPRRLFAAHLLALASGSASLNQAEGLYLQAIELHPGDRDGADPDPAPFNPSNNAHNFIAWDGLAECRYARHDIPAALNAYREAVVRCPQWAEGYAAFITQQMPEPDPQSPERARWEFFTTLDIPRIRHALQHP